MNSIRPITILLVEDDPGHSRLIEINLRRAGFNSDIIKLSDGNKALDYLYSRGRYENRVLPNPLLILLDLNMPGVDGYEILKTLKEDPQRASIPVIILTTTDEPSEVERCYELGCNAYITKPVEYDLFAKTVQELGLFVSMINIT